MTPSPPGRSRRRVYDVAVIGGGIVGCSAAVFLARAGLSVVLLERAEIAAGASGRNSGAIQRPFDTALAELYHETLTIYRTLAGEGPDFQLASEPAGLLLLSDDADALAHTAAAIAAEAPDLQPERLDAEALAHAEPGLAPGLAACRLQTGFPVAPAAATLAFAALAKRLGVTIRVGAGDASVVVHDGRAAGVVDGAGQQIRCGAVLIAAGPWSPALVPGWSAVPPIRSVWGVVVGVDLANAPRHVLEELGIDRPGDPPGELFSMVTAGGRTSVGSTFLAQRPDANERSRSVLDRARRFAPALARAPALAVRVCARPVSFDGRPLIGAVPGVERLFVCAGHGPWGISTGPASARLVVDQILGTQPQAATARAFSAARAMTH